MLTINRHGREFIYIPVVTAPAGVLGYQVSVRSGEWVDAQIDQGDIRILVAGPEAQDNPDGTLVLSHGVNHVAIRAENNTEILIRQAARIVVG